MADNSQQVAVELVEHSPDAPFSGIGRYSRSLYNGLLSRIPVRLTAHVDPPLTTSVPFLHHLPVGVQAHRAGSIVHFVEDLGCSQMLWCPVRPAIATSHDLGMLVWPPEARMHRPLDRLIWLLSYLGLKRMDAVMTVSEFSRKMVIERLGIPAERVFAIHSGIDHSRFKPVDDSRAMLATRHSLGDVLGPNYKNLLYVGTEIPRKNLITLLRVLTRLPSNVRLLKVGAAGGERFRESTKKAIAEFGLTDRVLFLEQVPDEDLTLLYNAADVYICCSVLEGFGHPVLEAMACGTPVVGSNIASVPEITGDAAILVPPRDVEGFAEAILALLCDSSLRQRMIARGLQRASIFSWERTAEAVTAVYHQVACSNESSKLAAGQGR